MKVNKLEAKVLKLEQFLRSKGFHPEEAYLPQTPSPARQTDPVPPSEGAELLLAHVEESHLAHAQIQQRSQEEVGMEAETEQVQEPQKPQTPQPTGWRLGAFFKRWTPKFVFPQPPPMPLPPATAPPTMLPAVEAEQLRDALAPTPTKEPSQRSKPQKPKTTGSALPPLKKTSFSQRAMVSQALKSVKAEDKPRAKAWLKEAIKKLDQGDNNPGDKRKLLDRSLKISDLATIPARAPWQTEGTYGIQDDFFDSDDEAEVPLYHLVDLAANHPDEPVPKKRKTEQVDTHGNSASLNDLHPRPSLKPSPMFGSQDHPYQGGNIFDKTETPPPSFHDRAALEKELRRTGHVPGTGTFCVPESDSEDEDTAMLDDTSDNIESTAAGGPTASTSVPQSGLATTIQATSDLSAPLWTQQPPPAPTPAHALLPNPITSTPVVPPVEGEDPVKAQRQRALKHTPLKPSRLRQQTVISPSVDSDAEDDNTIAAATGAGLGSGLLTQSIRDAAPHMNGPQTPLYKLPDPTPISFNDPILAQAMTQFVTQPNFTTQSIAAWGGAEVEISYDSSDDDDNTTFPDGNTSLYPAELDAELDEEP
ncbi:hypothetical protein K469DRAFT_707008 [Zopfia rhizophila CBS 207.26]|uniref:Uncharacterized protein n=1 Tax=Zopfia rhizophila CBS 207.26 TaxID=1314779 RepID=A0A6A6E5S9_9PEZI|nr:hypothetical protein K469DRAFT_707008 [Zopfia rhizophila CBS 207.26]